MNSRIEGLAKAIKLLGNSEKFVLMLGAGASVSSGVPLAKTLIPEILEQRPDLTEGSQDDRFDKIWREASPDSRERYLKSYLDKQPGTGYKLLAELIRDGYFDHIITLNFDRLLERALVDAGMRPDEDFLTIVRGDRQDEAIEALVARPEPRVKILKLHGSIAGGSNLLFSGLEMVVYPESIRKVVNALTRKRIIVCGYAFEDVCMMKTFAEEGEQIYCVNIGGLPRQMRGYVVPRNSLDLTIQGEDGAFDNFVASLKSALTPAPVQPAAAPQCNPFKYLGSLGMEDRDALYGRDQEVRELLELVGREGEPKPILLYGASRVGKTSLTRAGLLPGLSAEKHLSLYLRCAGTIVQSLDRLRRSLDLQANGEDVVSMLDAVAAHAAEKGRQAVLILDQFERVDQYPNTAAGRSQMQDVLRPLLAYRNPNLRVICIFVYDHDSALVQLTIKMKDLWEGPVVVYELESAQAREVLLKSTARAGVEFGNEVVDLLIKEYEKDEFTLAHLHSVCSILCESAVVDTDAYKRIFKRESPVLNIVINSCDIVNLIEDVPARDAELLRRIIRDIEHADCNKIIVNCIKRVNQL